LGRGVSEASPALPPGTVAQARLAEYLGVLAAEMAKLRGDLPQINDLDLRPRIDALLAAGAAITAAQTDEPGAAIAEDLNELLEAVRAIRLPAQDPTLGAAMPTLERLRSAKGLITTALMDGLDAARAMGWAPRQPALPVELAVSVPRAAVSGALPHIEARLDAVAARLDDLLRVRDQARDFPQQVGLINFFNTSMRAQLRLGKLQLKIGEELIDLAALSRIAERIGELTEDFYVTVRAWMRRVSASVIRVAEGVRSAARRVVGGIAATARLLRRRTQAPPRPAADVPPEAGAMPSLNVAEAVRMIRAGAAPPATWRPYLTSLDLRLSGLSDLGALANLTALQSLDLTGTGVSNVKPLERLTALQSLNLWGTGVTDLTPLERLTALQSLNLTGTRVSDLKPLERLTGLQNLDLTGAQVSDLTPLERLTALQSLSLEGTQVSDLKPLERLTALQSLNLGGTGVSDLKPLERLTALQSLNLWGTQVSDLKPLERLTALQGLDLWDTQVSDLTPLERLAALQSLSLLGTQVSDLKPLERLTALQGLNLGDTKVSDLRPLERLTALQSLTLGGTQVSDLKPLERLTALQSLNLSRTQASDLTPLERLTALQSLDLSGIRVSDLKPLERLTALQRLILWGTLVSDEALGAFQATRAAGGLPPIQILR
jgi:internalin A